MSIFVDFHYSLHYRDDFHPQWHVRKFKRWRFLFPFTFTTKGLRRGRSQESPLSGKECFIDSSTKGVPLSKFGGCSRSKLRRYKSLSKSRGSSVTEAKWKLILYSLHRVTNAFCDELTEQQANFTMSDKAIPQRVMSECYKNTNFAMSNAQDFLLVTKEFPHEWVLQQVKFWSKNSKKLVLHTFSIHM